MRIAFKHAKDQRKLVFTARVAGQMVTVEVAINGVAQAYARRTVRTYSRSDQGRAFEAVHITWPQLAGKRDNWKVVSYEDGRGGWAKAS